MKRSVLLILFVPILFFALSVGVQAEEYTLPSLPIPPELTEHFGALPSDANDLSGWFDTDRLVVFGQNAVQNAFTKAVQCFMALVAVASLCAVMGALANSIEHKGIVTAFSYTAVLVASAVMLSFLETVFSAATSHLKMLSAFASGVIPVYAGVCTAGGMGGLSLAGSGGLALASSFAALLSAKMLLPLLRICFVLGFSASVSGLPGISQISGTVRRFFVGAVGGVGTLLAAVFAFQSEIAAKADTLGGRTVRYVTASVLPLVGGALSEASRTLSSAFSLVSGMVGWVGVAAVLLLLLPILAELFVLRLCFLSAGGIAEILSLPRIAGLYRDGAALVGALMAILSLVDAVLIFEFALLARI